MKTLGRGQAGRAKRTSGSLANLHWARPVDCTHLGPGLGLVGPLDAYGSARSSSPDDYVRVVIRAKPPLPLPFATSFWAAFGSPVDQNEITTFT